jgi:Domain of unknown function (DUF3387)
MREQRNPHLAIEALRRLVEQEMRTVTRHNIVKQKSFAERLADLMRIYIIPPGTSPPQGERRVSRRMVTGMARSSARTSSLYWQPMSVST